MTGLTRQSFLRLASASAAAAIVAPAQAAQRVPAAPRIPADRPTLIRGADILTMDRQHSELTATDLLIENGRIAALGRDLSPPPGADVVDGRGKIVMPGLIDGHRHVWGVLGMGQLVKTELKSAYRYTEWKMRAIPSMTPEDHYLAGLIGGLHAIDQGVTTLLDFSHGANDADKAVAAAKGLKDSGVAGWFAFQMGVSSSCKPGDTVPFATAKDQLVAPAQPSHWATLERLRKDVFSDSGGLLQLGIAPAAGLGRPIAEIRADFARARALGIGMLAAHINKLTQPAPEGFMGHRDSGIADLADVGLLGPDYHISHGCALTPGELALLRDTGGMICATPLSEFPFVTAGNSGPAVHARARAAGVPAGIGIDVNFQYTHDYFEHCRAAFWHLCLDREDLKIAEGYKSADVLDFATGLGAQAIRLGDVTGSIAVGKRADLLLLKTDRIGFAASGSLADRVLNFAALQDIDSVWLAGRIRKSDGRMIDVDWADLKRRQAAAWDRIGKLGASITFTS